jgi:hypothetical protein
VPAGLARRRVEVRLRARGFDVIADGRVVATHQRALHKGEEHLVLDHYWSALGLLKTLPLGGGLYPCVMFYHA